MQCPPGLSVSKHFYWSNKDPCTEQDTEEQCVLGYLKKMHLKNKVVEDKSEKEEEAPELAIASKPSNTEYAAENSLRYEEEGNDGKELEAEVNYEGHYYLSPGDVGGARQAPLLSLNDQDAEPELVPEAEADYPSLVKEDVLKVIEANENDDNVYYPEQQRAHIVEAYVPRHPVPLYGGYRRYNGPFHYFPQKFYPAPAKQEPAKKVDLPEIEEESLEPTEKVIITTTPEPHYLPPEARSARLMGSQIDLTEAGRQQSPNIGQDDYSRDYREPVDYPREYDYQPEYIYEDHQTIPTPETKPDAGVTNAPVGNSIIEAEHRSAIDNQDEELADAAEVTNQKEEPIVYDYFKTHFIEEV